MRYAIERHMRKHTLVQKYLAIGLCLLAGFMFLRTFELGPWAEDRTSKIPMSLMEHIGYLTLEARVNGKPIRMLIDTGGSTSVFDAGLIEELQLPRVKIPGSISGLLDTEEHCEGAHIEKL